MRKRLYIIIYVFSILFSGCIEEYNAKGVDELSNLLVVEGTISEGTTTIILSRSVGLHDEVYTSEQINHANVYVESEDGTTFSSNGSVTGGIYVIPINKLNPESKYRLKIHLDNEEYESDFQYPIVTPEIDKIFWTKNKEKKMAYINVATKGLETQPRYYNWSFQEHWEVIAKFYSNFDTETDEFYNEYDGPFNLKYYCWNSNRSNSFILESSDKLSENTITGKILVETPVYDTRFSYLYYIKVKQNMLSKEAYDYFTNLQKNIETTGSIFSPIPSEMKGNMYCVTNPDIPVIGYIEVSNTTEKDIYIPMSDGLYESTFDGCQSLTSDNPLFEPRIHFLYYRNPLDPRERYYAEQRCWDCTRYATKNKPDFWPNDHK